MEEKKYTFSDILTEIGIYISIIFITVFFCNGLLIIFLNVFSNIHPYSTNLGVGLLLSGILMFVILLICLPKKDDKKDGIK